MKRFNEDYNVKLNAKAGIENGADKVILSI